MPLKERNLFWPSPGHLATADDADNYILKILEIGLYS